MKRLIIMLLSLLMALNLCACNILPVSAPTTDPTETIVVTVPDTTTDTTETSYPWLNAESTQKFLDCGWSLENIDIIMGVIPDMDSLYTITKISDSDYALLMDNGIEYYATFRNNTLIQVYTNYENPTEKDFLYNVG